MDSARRNENVRYFGDSGKRTVQQKNDAMEYWTPEENNKKKEPDTPPEKTKSQSKKDIPIIRKPRVTVIEKIENASAGFPEPLRKISLAFTMRYRRLAAQCTQFKETFGCGRNKVAPITSKVQARHLEMEPLCCISSCLVRGGCTGVISFEGFYVVTTLLCIVCKFYSGGRFHFWKPFEHNFNAYVTHHIFLYIVLAFDLITILMMLILTHGLLRFDKKLVMYHYRFDYFALVFNILAFFLYSLAISSKGPSHWDLTNTVLVINFAMQMPLQLWALSVVKSCGDFFALIQVFVSLAEA